MSTSKKSLKIKSHDKREISYWNFHSKLCSSVLYSRIWVLLSVIMWRIPRHVTMVKIGWLSRLTFQLLNITWLFPNQLLCGPHTHLCLRWIKTLNFNIIYEFLNCELESRSWRGVHNTTFVMDLRQVGG